MIANASQVDPSRTALERRSFAAEMTRRFDALRKAVWNLIVVEDALDLLGGLTGNASEFGVIHDKHGTSYRIYHQVRQGEDGFMRHSFAIHEGDAEDEDLRKGRNQLGRADLTRHGDTVMHVHVVPEYQRKGLASALYDHIESTLGRKLKPNDVRTDAGQALWSSRTHPTTTNALTANAGPVDEILHNPDKPEAGLIHYTHNRPTTNALWDFRTAPEKVALFRQWLQRQINLKILETRTASGLPSAKKPWLAPRIIGAYKKGVARAYADARKRDPYAGPEIDRARESQHLEAILSVQTSKIELLYTRAYEDLAGVTADMATKLGRFLATGLINGDSPHAIARKMAGQIAGLSLRRARYIARTEIIHAHAEGTLDGLAALGVKAVGALVESQTAGDARVCPKCKHLEGRRFTIEAARGRIPVHPLCRCAWVPVK